MAKIITCDVCGDETESAGMSEWMCEVLEADEGDDVCKKCEEACVESARSRVSQLRRTSVVPAV